MEVQVDRTPAEERATAKIKALTAAARKPTFEMSWFPQMRRNRL